VLEERAEEKTEFAREIFEEIKKLVALKIPPHIRLIFKDDRNFEDGFRDGKTDALFEVLVLITELKKKYTQGKEEIPPCVRMDAKALPAILNVKYTEETI
jgi:hypothetical protein